MSFQEKTKLRGNWTIDKFDDPDEKIAKYLQNRRHPYVKRIMRLLSIDDPPRTVEDAKQKFRGKHIEHIDMGDNLMLNAGITVLLNLLIGAAGQTNFSITNARLTVGTGTTAAAATNTALTTFAFAQGLDAGFPTVSGQAVTFQVTVAGANGLVSWQEFGADNYAATGGTAYTTTAPTYTAVLVLLNHLVSNQGTKVSGQTWILKLTITES